MKIGVHCRLVSAARVTDRLSMQSFTLIDNGQDPIPSTAAARLLDVNPHINVDFKIMPLER